ncbi:c-type cytochrome domain-containing protein [Paraglaciecola sp. L3A3]|uniref:c-type cytochrome domain-containing protein n=1 Tax=Paraglaciecola sp. L3A3 TaxID=2686358 RepID=UPI00131B274F|nr:c-type cytochrome domain-containing protein [Paraglaciecola sp. L3A3]
MQSSLPRHYLYSLILGLVLITFLLCLPYLADLDGEVGNDWAIFFGRFHIVVLHLPIGWLMLVPFIEVISRKCQLAELSKAIRFILYFAAISAVLAVIVGFTLASSDGYSGELVTTHMWLGITTAIFTILACLANETYHLAKKHIYQITYFACLSIALVAVIIGGHLGGSLVQGEGYLTEKLPTELKITLGLEKPEMLLSLETPIYQGFIEPMLAQQCMSCHNAGKIKGQFQMDTLDGLFKGGKSKKPSIVAGDAEGSELFHRVSLPRDDDQAMPPEGRTPLNEQQLTLMKWWINAGAPTENSIHQLANDKLTPEVSLIIEQLIAESQERLFPLKTYTSMQPMELQKHVNQLKDNFGIDISTVSQDPKDGLQISSFNFHTPLSIEARDSLKPLAEFITAADLGDMSISSEVMNEIANLSQLRVLLLDNAKIAGDLAPLSRLNKLQVLNLFNTKVGDESAKTLVQISSLKKLYLANTDYTEQGLNMLEAQLSHTKIYHSVVKNPVNAAVEISAETNEDGLDSPTE